MKTIGLITTGAAGLIALVGLVLGIRAVPDVRRYLRMKSM